MTKWKVLVVLFFVAFDRLMSREQAILSSVTSVRTGDEREREKAQKCS